MRAGEDRAGGGGESDECGGVEEGTAGRCSCLPFCLPSRRAAAVGERRRVRRKFRIRLRLSWISWPWWLPKSGDKKKTTTTTTAEATKGRKGMKRMLRLLLTSSSSQAKKVLATSVSSAGGSFLLPKASSFADGKNQRNGGNLPRRQTTVAGGDAAPATSVAEEATAARQPCPRPAAVRTAPSRRRDSLSRPDGCAGAGGLWTMATTLGVIVFFGRVTAVAFLCSCLYGSRFVRAQAAGTAKAKSGGGGGSEKAAAEERVVVHLCTEEHKKKEYRIFRD
ncbi:hypothetical protein ABZP36_012708 [Zizania latifolia]